MADKVNNVYDRRVVLECDDVYLEDSILLKDFIADFQKMLDIKSKQGINVRFVTEHNYEEVAYYITYERLETDEEYNQRIAIYEKGKVKRDSKAAEKRAKEIEQLRKLKEKYPNE